MYAVEAPADGATPPEATEAGTGTTGPPASSNPCVPTEDLVTSDGLLGIDPAAVGFGEIAPDDLQGNFAPVRLSNRGAATQSVAFISCTPLENMAAVVSSFFVVQFGPTGAAPRVKCALLANLYAFHVQCWHLKSTLQQCCVV
jgi:hypothetical protein